MNKIQIKRLRKLYDHLKNGKLGHSEFNFNFFNWSDDARDYDEKGCGTMGCAVGELPFVFPRYWEFKYHNPYLKGSDTGLSSLGLASEFFGISYEEATHLFIPDLQQPERYGGVHLDANATRQQVADNILKFLNRQ